VAVLRPRSYKTSAPTAEDVLLLVEVAETSLRFDRTVKLALYARAGIPWYWLANATAETVTVYRQPAGKRTRTCAWSGPTARSARSPSPTSRSASPTSSPEPPRAGEVQAWPST
jgi:hypothetical protein